MLNDIVIPSKGTPIAECPTNHPDFVGIIPILLENPESRRNFGWDRKLFSSNKQGNEILDLDLR